MVPCDEYKIFRMNWLPQKLAIEYITLQQAFSFTLAAFYLKYNASILFKYEDKNCILFLLEKINKNITKPRKTAFFFNVVGDTLWIDHGVG